MSAIADFHSHILPGIDDGSACVAESIALLKLESEQRIRHVVATPHFYARHDSPEHFLENRRAAERQLREEMSKYPDLPEISVGAEVYYFEGMSNSDALQELTIGGSEYILVEMPMAEWTDRMYRELEQIPEKQGLTPIVAHVDRYIAPFATHKIPARLAELPVLVQANAEFFLNRSTARMALRMLRQGKIQLLGSDCHNMKTRKPNLGEAIAVIERRLGKEALDWIRENQQEVMSAATDDCWIP